MMRKNQKGFTLVELIIAVAILAIVTLAVCGFIVVGSKSYTSANTDIMLQQEAQLALNQISDVIIDTTDSISYSVGTSTSLQHVLKDSEYGGEATDKCLVVVNRNDASSNNRNPSYWFYWSKADEAIYFNEVTVDSTMTADEIQAGFDSADTDKAVLAEHVTDLSIDISQFEENRVVMISMVLKNGNREYSTSNNVTVRNKIALNVVDIDPMKRADEFKINLDVTRITLEPGEHYQFTASVETSSSDKAIEWEFADSSANDATLTKDGSLTIGKSQFESFYVRVIRSNEEYVGQNDRVSKRVKVNVKRVTFVSDNELTAAPGDTVELSNAAIRGQNLSEYCFGIGCSNSDDVYLLDKDSWKITSDAALASIESPGDKKAMVKISPSAKEGDVIVVEAASLRSSSSPKGLGYGPESNPTTAPVKGEWRIKIVDDEPSSAIPLGSMIKYGTDNDPGVYDYMRSELPTVNGEYVFCVRIREAGTRGCANDWYKVYFTNGANLRFSPDSFGLDLTKKYDVYMQVLYPVSMEYLDDIKAGIGHDRDNGATVWSEYSQNLDAEGKYIGERYWASEYYVAALNPPTISVSVGGTKYPNENPNMHETISILGATNQQSLGMIDVDSDETINMWFNSVNGNNRMVIYKEDDNGIWRRVYGYGYDLQETVSAADRAQRIERIDLTGKVTIDAHGKFNGSEKGYYLEENKNQIGPLIFQPKDNPSVKLDTNNLKNGTYEDACGTYHIMAGFVYANDPDCRNGAYTSSQYLIAERINGDFNPYYYRQWDCVINLEVTMDFNLQLPNENGQERRSYFPVPSDRAFPFARNITDIQTTTWSFSKFKSSGEQVWDGYSLNNIKVDCEYNRGIGGEADSYTLWLYIESNRNGASYTRNIIGKYKCRPNGKEWDPVRLGTAPGFTDYTERVDIPTNIDYTKDNGDWLAYFPLPSETEFKSMFGDIDGTTSKSYSFVAYNKNDNHKTKNETMNVECTLKNGEYTIEFANVITYPNNPHRKDIKSYGKWSCAANGNAWNKIGWEQPARTEAIWGPCIIAEGMRFEFPGPDDPSFPKLNNGQTITKYDVTLNSYGSGDSYGEWGMSSAQYTIEYSNINGIITVTIYRPDWGNKKFGTWRWDSSVSNWVSN